MAVVSLGNNVSALRAQSQLSRNGERVSTAMERLSSGMRITKPSDDAAGVSVSASLNVAARINTQGVRNMNDALSMFNIADAATGELKNITTRLQELAVQAASGSISYQQRKSLDSEFQALMKEHNRIIDTTKFNGIAIFSEKTGSTAFQAGLSTLGLNFTAEQTVGTGTFEDLGGLAYSHGSAVAADFDGDGRTDLVAGRTSSGGSEVLFYRGNGDGTFGAPVTYATGLSANPSQSTNTHLADINNDGFVDVVFNGWIGMAGVSTLLSNGDGTFKAPVVWGESIAFADGYQNLALGDINSDGIVDLVKRDLATGFNFHLGNGDGTFTSSVTAIGGGGGSSVVLTDMNGDGISDLLVGSVGVRVAIGRGDGNFESWQLLGLPGGVQPLAFKVGDFNNDGHKDVAAIDYNGGSNVVTISLGNGDGTFKAALSFSTAGMGAGWDLELADFNGDGKLDIATGYLGGRINSHLGNGDGTFQAYTEVRGPVAGNLGIVAADFNGDGIADIVNSERRVLLKNGQKTAEVSLESRKLGIAGLSDYSIASMYDAKQAITAIGKHQTFLHQLSATLGAAQSRLHVASSVLNQSALSYREAESRIRDVDIAAEHAELVRSQILQQAQTALLAQIHRTSEIVLTLLGNQ